MNASLQYWPKHSYIYIIKYKCILVRQKMIYEQCSSSILYLMSFSAGYIIQTHSFSLLFTSCIADMFEHKNKSVNILILLFYICPPEVQFQAICISFMNTGYKFFLYIYILHRVYILHCQLIRIGNPSS